jgi:hypothetical protein
MGEKRDDSLTSQCCLRHSCSRVLSGVGIELRSKQAHETKCEFINNK